MTIRGLLERSAANRPDAIAFTWCEDKVWKNRTWAEHLKGVREIAEGYGRTFGLKPHEENGAIILGNSPTWMEAYLAQVGTGAASRSTRSFTTTRLRTSSRTPRSVLSRPTRPISR